MRPWIALILLASSAEAAHAACDTRRVIDGLPSEVDTAQFCEACGDRAPEMPVVIGKAELAARDPVVTYVKTSPRHYDNLAALAGCEIGGASPGLHVAGATEPGVLISADPTPIVPVPQLALPVAQPPPPPPPPPATSTVYIYTTTETVGWLPIVAACLSTSALWAFGTLAVVRRRRRHLEPRAVDLIPTGERLPASEI